MRVVERVGKKLSEQISNKTPWSNRECGRLCCQPCATQPGKCLRSNITYLITCVNYAVRGVKTVYVGESHRTYHDRQAEHLQALATSNTNYGTVKHHLEHHANQEMRFSFRYNSQHKSSLERQIQEALIME